MTNYDNDFEFVSSVFDKMCDAYGPRLNANAYNITERNLFLTCHACGIIDNGGFEYLLAGSFRGDRRFDKTIAAHAAVRLAGYESFVEMRNTFPGRIIPINPKKRAAQYQLFDEEVRSRINETYWDEELSGERSAKIAEYIRQNEDKLSVYLH